MIKQSAVTFDSGACDAVRQRDRCKKIVLLERRLVPIFHCLPLFAKLHSPVERNYQRTVKNALSIRQRSLDFSFSSRYRAPVDYSFRRFCNLFSAPDYEVLRTDSDEFLNVCASLYLAIAIVV